MSRYCWVDCQRVAGFPVAAACEAAGVSTSAFYDWATERAHGPTDAEWDDAHVVNAMIDVQAIDDSVGSPRMVNELARQHGIHANHERVEPLMADNGIYAKDGRRPKVKTTIPDVTAPPLPDLVQRDFTPGEPGERTCGDTQARAGAPLPAPDPGRGSPGDHRLDPPLQHSMAALDTG